jgi:hypothetical protein
VFFYSRVVAGVCSRAGMSSSCFAHMCVQALHVFFCLLGLKGQDVTYTVAASVWSTIPYLLHFDTSVQPRSSIHYSTLCAACCSVG